MVGDPVFHNRPPVCGWTRAQEIAQRAAVVPFLRFRERMDEPEFLELRCGLVPADLLCASGVFVSSATTASVFASKADVVLSGRPIGATSRARRTASTNEIECSETERVPVRAQRI